MASLFQSLWVHRKTLLLYGIALAIRLTFAVPFIHDWDGFVFSESAKNFLKGETPYMTVLKNDPTIYPDSDKPMIQQWYGYPPLPLMMFTAPLAVARLIGLPLTELTETLLLKLPFIFGDLLAAWLVKKFLETKHGNVAKRAELLVLFNPLLIWVSSAWGMFDIWMANFLLLFLLALRKKYIKRAGVFLALACTTKLFPVFFLPIIAVYAFNTIADTAQRRHLIVSFVITLTLIVAPFFLTSPRGFLNQNLLMHLQRPSQGLSIPAMYDHYADIYRWPAIPVVGISTVVMYATMALAFFHALIVINRKEENLIWSMMVIYTSMLIFNKVTNEQYFVLLIVFLIILSLSIARTSVVIPRKLLYATKMAATYGVLIAAALLGFHFLGFLLPGLTQEQLRSSTNNLVFYLSRHFSLPLYTYPDSAWTYYNIPITIASVAMAPFIVAGLMIVWTEWRQTWNVRKQIVHQLNGTAKQALGALGSASWKIKLVIVLLVSVGFSGVPSARAYINKNRLFTPVSLLEDKDVRPLPEQPRVGTFYNVWWNNFSHYKDFPYGDWSKTTLTPTVGYYTSKNSYYVQHIKQMKQAGIDFALVSYHLYDRKRYLTFSDYAEKLGLYYSPMIETYDVLAYDEFRPIGPDGKKMLAYSLNKKSMEALQKIIISSLIDNVNRPAVFRVDGKPAVFVFFGHWFYPSWDDEYKHHLAQLIVGRYSQNESDPYAILSDSWSLPITSIEDVIFKFPENADSFNMSNRISQDYKLAFMSDYESFWKTIRQNVESIVGPVILLSTYPPYDPKQGNIGNLSNNWKLSNEQRVIESDDIAKSDAFNGEWFYGISSTWYAWRNLTDDFEEIKKKWEEQIAIQVRRDRESGRPVILTVIPAYDERFVRAYNPFEPIPPSINNVETYDWTWETALQYNPDYILITSWNEFFEGTAIEPSKEHGDYYIGRTAEWSQKFRSQPRY